MILQYLIVSILIAWALGVTTLRLVRFFSAPPSRCQGCSGCALKSRDFTTFDSSTH